MKDEQMKVEKKIYMPRGFEKHELLPAIVQDAKTKQVLMAAYMNEEAYRKTMETKKTHFYSRSRNKLWLKGEESGHVQTVKKIFVDCDEDTLLLFVTQNNAACHKGYKSCFFSEVLDNGNTVVREKKIFDPLKVYKTKK